MVSIVVYLCMMTVTFASKQQDITLEGRLIRELPNAYELDMSRSAYLTDVDDILSYKRVLVDKSLCEKL